MLIIGNEHIPYDIFTTITSIDDIKNTKANSTVVCSYDINIIKYTQKNNIKIAVLINNIKEAIFCNALDVDFIIVNKDISENIQKIAQNYMFDSKILQIISNDNEIQEVALNEIDGCIYNNLIKGI